jgi:catecholate siderophore receptor
VLQRACEPATTTVAAACIVAVGSTFAVAQTTGGGLPPVTVEAPAKKKAPARAPAAKKQAPASAAPVIPSATVDAGADGAGAPAPDANPYANPNAPYKVENSASGKLTEPIADTPRSITAIPKEVIDDMGARDLRELARNVPGLTIGTAEGGNSYGALAVRGFKANNDVFVDGIRNPGNVTPDVFSVQQIEIYKGPSGGIAGRSTIGGAINIVSKTPNLSYDFYTLATTIGTDNTFRTTVDINKTVTPNLAFRANVMYDQHDVAGRDITESERWGGLLSATAKPSDGMKITLDYYRYRNDAIPDWGVPVRRADRDPITEHGIPRNTWVGMKGLDFFNEEADIGTATIVAKLSDAVTLTNKTRIGQSRLAYVATSMEGIPDVHHPNRDQTSRIYANQTELNAKFTTGTFKHNLVAGIEVTREEIDRDAYDISNCCSATRPFPPNPNSPTDFIRRKGNLYNAKIDTIAGYLTDTIHLSEQWIINGGLRWDDYTRDQVGGTGAAGTTLPSVNTAKVQENLFSWHAGIVYKPIPIASIYAAYATSESPVGSELDSTGAQYNGLGPTLINVPPQEARSVEFGTKWELFRRRLLATAAVFQTDVDHARTNDNVATIAAQSNASKGKYRVRGIEVTTTGKITDALSVFGGVVLLDTEVLDSVNPQDIGRRLANIPLTQFSMLARYKLTSNLSVSGSATYAGEVFNGHLAMNASRIHTVDWWRFDAFAEYKLTNNIEIQLAGLNLTDELYYDAVYQAGTGTNLGTFAFVAPGRAGYLTVKFKY